MKQCYLSGILLSLAFSQTVLAQQNTWPQDHQSYFLKLFDGDDHDGMVTEVEFNEVMLKRYQTMDTDNNGVVSLAEFKHYNAERRKNWQQKKLRRMDRDENGFISKQEFTDQAIKRAERRFSTLDKNHDGQLSQQENAENDRIKKHLLLKRMDKNQDGQISPEEYTTMSQRWFNNLDSNQDKIVTADELKGRFHR